jgi:phage repressor protein C with HTH and peptisase S24 domain
MMKISRAYLADIERGKREPSYNFLRKFLETTGVSSEWLLRETGPMISNLRLPEDGDRRDIDFLMDAGLEKLDCGLYAIGEKIFLPLSSVEACCGAGFDVFDDYTIGDAIAADREKVGILRSDMLPYAVKTEGRSMEGYGIKENSTVIVNPSEDVYSGCVALVVLGGKACIKKIYDTSNGKDLLASNGEKVHLSYEELAEDWGPRILGRVMVVISPPDVGV